MTCEAGGFGCRSALAASLGLATADHDDVFAFNANSTAETITEGLDLTGLTYLVTGATGALGSEVTRVLALRGARVVLACRSQEKGEALASKILDELGLETARDAKNALVVMGGLDLGSKASTESFANEFCKRALPLTGLVCCAGVVCQPFKLTRDGRESHFGVNHLGHFFLQHLLLDEIVRTAASSGAQGRIVLVSSGAHHFTYRVRRGVPRPSRGIDFANLDEPVGYDAGRAYAQSKLAVALHASELDERLRRSGVNVAAFAADPGTMGAELKHALNFPGGGLLFALAEGRVTRDARRAAATVVWCAAAERRRLAAPSGAAASRGATNYYADCAPRKPSLPARDPRLARRLWEESERLLGMPRGAAKPAAPDVEDGRGGFDGEPPRSPKSPASPPFVAGEGGGSVSPLSPAPSASMSMHRGGGAAVLPAEGRSAAEPGSPASPAIRVTPSKSGRWGLGMAPAKASAD
jgi:WW domain-containing oxidoreductase